MNGISRIIWIPWAPPGANEFLERSKQWVRSMPNKNFKIVVYDPKHAKLGVGPHPFLMNLNEGSQIYLRGHGYPGSPSVRSQGNTLGITESIDRLLEMGLDSNYRGAFKFYSCYSALTGKKQYIDGGKGWKFNEKDPNKTKPIGGNWDYTLDCGKKSLAKVGTGYFHQLGFKRNKFYGYKGPLSGNYVDATGSGDFHKYCEEVIWKGDGRPTFEPNKNRRASEARKSF